tara:strand:- start:2634 stop:2891 length:258 start_codon:yes stop_codon:yes gene_type:complete
MLKEIIENYPDNEILKMDGFDDAVIGYHEQSNRVIYSVKKVIDIIYNEMQNADDFTLEDAFEHFSFNIQSTWVGEFTPILCYDIF